MIKQTIKQLPAYKEALLRRFYATCNARNWDALDDLMAEDVVDHNPLPDQPKGLAGVKRALARSHAAFSDIQIEIEQTLISGHYITVRQIARGTHDGEFLGHPATASPWRSAEGYHRGLRKVVKTKRAFPTSEAARKLLYLANQNITQKWTMPLQNWANILNQLAIRFTGAFPADGLLPGWD
jgi:predicted ester cyclase